MGYIGKQPIVGNFQVCDAISVVNGQAAYTMQVNSTNVEPETAFHMLVSLNGILQKPGSSFTISGSTITFASNLVTNDVIDFIILLGDVLNIGAPSDGTVTTAKIADDAVTAAKLASGAGGKLLQSSLVTTSTNQAISSTSYADLTGMTLDITPVSSTSKFLITSFMNIGLTVSSSSDESFFSQILRDSTVVNNADTGVGYGSIYYYTGDASNLHMFDVNVCEDDHNTSSQVTIKVQGKTASGQSIQFNLNSSKKSYLLVQEIET